jgi:hypothetical protein
LPGCGGRFYHVPHHLMPYLILFAMVFLLGLLVACVIT